MKLALVSPRFEPPTGGIERQVETLARGVAANGVEVEVLTQDAVLRSPAVSDQDGFRIRRFPTCVGRVRFAMAPGLWEHLRRNHAIWDVVHLHSLRGGLGLMVLSALAPYYWFKHRGWL